jgi:hypothetical protein
MKNTLTLPFIIILFSAPNTVAGDMLSKLIRAGTKRWNTTDGKSRVKINIPPTFPSDEVIDTNGTFLPEMSYYFTKKASQDGPIIMGPCAPCVCLQVCNADNDECLYAHEHKLNSPQELNNKIREHFTAPNVDKKLNLDVTLFSRTNEYNYRNWNFTEGSHEKRIEHIADKIAENNNIQKESIYFNQTTEEDEILCGEQNMTVLFKNKQAHNLSWRQKKSQNFEKIYLDYRLARYERAYLKEMLSEEAFHQFCTIGLPYNLPLYHVKEPNIAKISSLPDFKKTIPYQYLGGGIIALVDFIKNKPCIVCDDSLSSPTTLPGNAKRFVRR